MNERLLRNLLHDKKEQDWYDFKATMKLYRSDGKLVEQQRDELVKDILGFANGNSHTIRKTKYIIVGADDKEFDDKGCRVLHNVDYKTPSQSEIAKWFKDSCTPAIAGLECEDIPFQGVNLFVITIPPTFDLHETIRSLATPNATFQKHTVFMRQDEHIVPASVRDGITIQRLKHLHRQEIANPSALWLGIIVGGIVSFLVGGAKVKSTQIVIPFSDISLQIIFVILGIFFGGSIGYLVQRFNETRYDWRYMSNKQRFILLVVLLAMLVLIFAIRK